jgi:ribosomal protein S18 acetylase RimI-like enzyme
MLRSARPDESRDLVALAASTGIFAPNEAEVLLGGVLDDLHAGRLGEGHQAHVWANDETGVPEGWVYLAPTFKADGVWDLWWIGVGPQVQGAGVGGALLRSIEGLVRDAGGRLLIIETSSTPPLAPARRFYTRRGYQLCGTIPDFYAAGDDKVIFAKRLLAR